MNSLHGLKNQGEKNCFINSLLQSFYNLQRLKDYILSTEVRHDCRVACLYCGMKVIDYVDYIY